MSSPARFNMTNLRLDLAEMTGKRNALLAALQALDDAVRNYGANQHSGFPAAVYAALVQSSAAIEKATRP